MAKPNQGFTHEEDSATLGSDMSASWGLPGAMLLRRSLSRHFRPAATRQHTFGADDRIARLFSDRIARRRHIRMAIIK